MKRFPRIQPRTLKNGYISLCRQSVADIVPQTMQRTAFSVKSSTSLVDIASKATSLTSIKNPWVEQKDPNGSNLTYYWNPETNETTSLGAPKPRNWIEVKDPNGSELTYWWDPDAHETTALGAPKPSHLTAATPPQLPFGVTNPPPQTLGQSMKSMFWWGAGMSVAFAVVGALMR